MEIIERGHIVVCVVNGDYGKPRPAVVVQSDLFNPTHSTISICPITSHTVDAPLFRLFIEPDGHNGLKKPSQIMIDKISSISREKIREKIGTLKLHQLKELNKALKIWLQISNLD